MKQLALAVALVVGGMPGVAADATVTGTWTMNVEGGPHGNALYICASTSLYRIRLNTRGAT